MSIKELLDKWYHRKVHVNLGGLRVSVVVLDIKERWGKIRYLISPADGHGEIWVENILEIN